jgi:hypothetical protein
LPHRFADLSNRRRSAASFRIGAQRRDGRIGKIDLVPRGAAIDRATKLCNRWTLWFRGWLRGNHRHLRTRSNRVNSLNNVRFRSKVCSESRLDEAVVRCGHGGGSVSVRRRPSAPPREVNGEFAERHSVRVGLSEHIIGSSAVLLNSVTKANCGVQQLWIAALKTIQLQRVKRVLTVCLKYGEGI